MQRVWWLFLVLALFSAGCGSQRASQPTPTAPAAGPVAAMATPVPLEPWAQVEGKGLEKAPVEQATAWWTGDLLRVVIQGHLPSPCYRLRASVRPNSPPAVVDLRLYMQGPPEGQECLQVLTAYTAEVAIQPPTMPLQVLVNGEPVLMAR